MAQAPPPPVWFVIFVSGLAAGMIVEIGVQTGITPDETGVLLVFLKTICTLTEDMNDRVAYNCGTLLAYAIVLSIIVPIIVAFATANQMGNLAAGLAIYGFGWIIGFVAILAYL